MPTRPKKKTRGVFERPKGSDVWWARYHDSLGRECRERVGPRGLALEVYRKRKTEIREGRFFPERIRRRDVALTDAIDDYLTRVEKTLRSHPTLLRHGATWKAALRGHTLRSVTPGDIERYIAERIRTMAPASVNRELAFLKRLFNVTIADGIAETNPVTKVRFLRERNGRTRFLTEDEEGQLRAEIGEEHWPTVLIALHTGLRQGEEFRLRWDDVDFATNLITVADSKSGDRRFIPMNESVRDCLTSLRSRIESPWVFASATGKTALDAKNFLNRVWLPAIKRAAIVNFRWHDLRHTFASRLVMRGTDILRVKELLGHKTIAMTLRYAHLAPGHLRDAVERLVPKSTGTKTGTSDEDGEPTVAAQPVGAGTRDGKKWPGTELNRRHRDFQSVR